MAVNWNNLAISTSCLLEHERICNRRTFIDEASLVRASAEFVQSTTQLLLHPEYNHPDLPGNQRLDLLAQSRDNAPATFIAEAKWIRARGGNRPWVSEIVSDILRLEAIQQQTANYTDRALIVGGIHRSLKAKLIEYPVRSGGGNPKIPIFGHVLEPLDPTSLAFPYNQNRKPIRDCDLRARQFWCAREEEIGRNLPVSYQCTLVGWHKAGPTQDSVEVYVWLIRRSKNRSDFNARTHFQ